ncbi:hypothetical protein LTR09_006765 [Extremus antarcticus]|uniref:Cercosporin MFS transporter CTB4 n=1 Tax=Extremus antarcticus TaxID=702011 RepID=A0AAJ0DKU6_9PEZI|nr:hypothetical protein LTR09_006765 [Extremus antarcticus]
MASGASQATDAALVSNVKARRGEAEEQSQGTTTSSSDTASVLERGEQDSCVSRTTTQHDLRHDFGNRAIALSRIQTARSQHSQTVGTAFSTRTTSRKAKSPIPLMGEGKAHPSLPSDTEEFVVEFDGPDDSLHPQNWRHGKKLATSMTLTFVTFTATFASSVYSPAISTVAQHFDVSTTVGILGISLYVLGFATGPILWAPHSELYGRKMPLLVSSLGFSIFQLPVAVAKDFQTILICRFFGGFFGACPLTVVAAVFADMFDNRQRGLAVTALSAAVFAGPLLAPIVGGFIVMDPSVGWRWTHYLTAIMGFSGLLLSIYVLEETYQPIILVNKAAQIRRKTKNWAVHAKQEEVEIDMRELLERNFSRPARMLLTEPIVLMLSIYMAFIYGLLYLFLTFYPLVFQELYGMNPGLGALPYHGMLVGNFLAGLYVAIDTPRYNRMLKANNDVPIPEWRLPPAILGGALFASGLFWFGWTGYNGETHWIVPTLSGLCTGFGLLPILLQYLNYLVDAYLDFAASAIAANTFLRSLCAAAFPLFARYMNNGLGVQWAGTLLGCIATLLVPVIHIFWKKGASIRAKSRFASQ